MKKEKFSLGCYSSDYAIFSVPLQITLKDLDEILGRGKFPINGIEITSLEFDLLRNYVLSGVEIGWSPELRYFIEG